MEKRVDYLESFEKNKWQTILDKKIRDKLEDMEHQARHNIRVPGFPEGKEGREEVKFYEDLIPDLLGIE